MLHQILCFKILCYCMDLPIYITTLLLTLFTWGMTAVGSSVVFIFKNINQRIIDFMLSFSAGVMIASGIFSLLLPSIEYSTALFSDSVIIPTSMFLAGGLFVVAADICLNKILDKKNTFDTKFSRKNILLFSAITFHNIPEGMCIGVAVANASLGGSALTSAVLLAIGIGLQNFPEGASISLPMRAQGVSRTKAFFYGQLSGIVEPIFALVACLFSIVFHNALPFLLAFSSGAMMCVSCTELIAEAVKENKNLASIGVLTGFCFMMILDLIF